MATTTATETAVAQRNVTRNDERQAPELEALPPGFPVARPTISHWQAHAADSPWHDYVHAPELKNGGDSHDVDLTIVGSGISGCLAAYFYLKERHHHHHHQQPAFSRSNGRVILLEARRACSGATGRNGGHCRPDSYAGYLAYSELFSPQSAHEILCNERETFELMRDIVHEEGLADTCEWWEGRSWSLFLDEDRKARGRKAFEAYKEAGHLKQGDGPGEVQWIEDAAEAKRMSRVDEAVGGATFEAGSLYPLKFCHAILEICVKRYGLELYTHTPVTAIRQEHSSQAWTVTTRRGTLTTSKLLLATNAYTTSLLPSMSTFLTPHRAQCSSIHPSASYHLTSPGRLQRTYSIGRREAADYEYLTQRPDGAGGYFILGGGHTVATKESQVGTWDDREVLPSISEHLSGYCGRTFDGWKQDGAAGDVEMIWTGIQGYSRDSVPTVGEVPAVLLPGATDRRLGDDDARASEATRTNLYICGSHHGHGMARAATCSRGIAREMAREASLLEEGADDEQWARVTGLPSVFRWTTTRAQRTDVDCRNDF